MKNLRKLSKTSLKTIIGGSAPLCDDGYRACVVGRTEHGSPIWDCIPTSSPCRP